MKDLLSLKIWIPHAITIGSVIFALGYYKASLETTLMQQEAELNRKQVAIERIDTLLRAQAVAGSDFSQRSHQVMTIQVDGINRRIEANERRAEATEGLIQALRSDLAAVRTDINWIRRALEVPPRPTE
jgi:hypothetical protein